MSTNQNESVPECGAKPLSISAIATRVTLIGLALVALGILLWQLAIVLLLVFGGILLAIFLRSLSEWTARWTGLSDGGALAIVILALAALFAAGLYLGGQAIANQMAELADQLPRSLDKLREDLSRYTWGEQLLRALPQSTEELPVSNREVTSYASSALSSLSGALAAFVIVVFLALYLAYDSRTYVNGALRLVPLSNRTRIADILLEVHETLRWWLLGKIISMALIGVLTTVGLAMLGVRLSLALGVIAALLTFVPNFGPIISAIPAILIAMVDSPIMGAYVAVLYLAIQTVESYLITPLIQQRTVSLPPALTISAQVGMGILLGAPGVVVATPLTAMLMVLVKRLYVEDLLERPSV